MRYVPATSSLSVSWTGDFPEGVARLVEPDRADLLRSLSEEIDRERGAGTTWNVTNSSVAFGGDGAVVAGPVGDATEQSVAASVNWESRRDEIVSRGRQVLDDAQMPATEDAAELAERLDDLEAAATYNDAVPIARRIAEIAGSIGLGAAGSGAWDGLAALAETLL